METARLILAFAAADYQDVRLQWGGLVYNCNNDLSLKIARQRRMKHCGDLRWVGWISGLVSDFSGEASFANPNIIKFENYLIKIISI